MCGLLFSELACVPTNERTGEEIDLARPSVNREPCKEGWCNAIGEGEGNDFYKMRGMRLITDDDETRESVSTLYDPPLLYRLRGLSTLSAR